MIANGFIKTGTLLIIILGFIALFSTTIVGVCVWADFKSSAF